MLRIETAETIEPYATDEGSKILVIPCGGTGCGKSTVLARMFPGFRTIDPDGWKERHPDYDPKNPGAVHRWSVDESVAECLGSIASGEPHLIYDTTAGTIERVAMLARAAKAAGYRVVMVKVWALESVAWQRNLMRDRTVARDAFDRTHAKVARGWGQLRALPTVDEYRSVSNHGMHEAPGVERLRWHQVAGCSWDLM